MQFDGTSFNPQNLLISAPHRSQVTRNDNITGLALGPHQSSNSGFQTAGSSGQSSSLTYDDWSCNRDNKEVDDFLSEEEIRIRSREMLENEEDMQHLLRLLTMDGHASINVPEAVYTSYIPSPSLNYSYDEDRTRSSGKGLLGLLKLKAAMWWAIFVSKKAAERRAQLVELDDKIDTATGCGLLLVSHFPGSADYSDLHQTHSSTQAGIEVL